MGKSADGEEPFLIQYLKVGAGLNGGTGSVGSPPQFSSSSRIDKLFQLLSGHQVEPVLLWYFFHTEGGGCVQQAGSPGQVDMNHK